MSGGNSEPGRTVTSKVLSILDAFSDGRTLLSLSQISQRARLPLATSHRLVKELVGWGGLERTVQGSYRVGSRLWEIGALTPQRSGLREIALPFMADL